MKPIWTAGLALAIAAPFGAAAQSPPEIEALRKEIDTLRSDYEARMRALEDRLKAAETAPPQATVAPTPSPSIPAAPAGGGANAFNPALSLILSGTYGRTSRDPAGYAITGIPLPDGSQAGPGARGFSLGETELGIAANVDPWLRGAANISLAPDDTVSVEEAFIQTTSLGNGLSLKAGRFFSGVGYLNEQHSHTWDFVDNPLAYQALLGTQFNDDGVQLRWIAPTDLFIEFGAELGRGRSFPGSDSARNGAGMHALYAHAGGDIGASQSWRAGLSMLGARARDQGLATTAAAGSALASNFTGRTRIWVADAVWKWAPDGNATRTSFKVQGEYLRGQRDGTLVVDPGGIDRSADYRATQSGWYLQGVWQFMPGWRVGLRTERLDPGTPDYGLDTALLATSDYRPRKNTLMLDFNASEFSRVRLQLARDLSREGQPDNQFFLQYQMSLGAHGAHSY
jgi:hypothetical protein